MVLVTGSAGFIGYHLTERLLADGEQVIGIDNLNDYYVPRLKYDRLAAAGIPDAAILNGQATVSKRSPDYTFLRIDLADRQSMDRLFEDYPIRKVVNLAAQAGVRYSLENPRAYIDSNVTGFTNVLECCRMHQVEHLVYASSSSVYGANEKIPFAETDRVDHPVSLYAATKKSNELLAHTYSHLFGLPTTGLRFFTVYGPWGRPDMAYSLFADAMLADRPIRVFNQGRMSRDFTYVTDIVEGIVRVLAGPPERGNTTASPTGAPYRLYNIGAGRPTKLLDFIELLETALGRPAIKQFEGMQAGDVERTFADTSALERDFGYQASTRLEEGIGRFVEWYLGYY